MDEKNKIGKKACHFSAAFEKPRIRIGYQSIELRNLPRVWSSRMAFFTCCVVVFVVFILNFFRHVMLFKKEFPPSEDEIEAYKRGETWDKQKAEDCEKQKVRDDKLVKNELCPIKK